jgi:hypothetical protein
MTGCIVVVYVCLCDCVTCQTQARASTDYHLSPDQWIISVSSIFAYAVGLAPTKVCSPSSMAHLKPELEKRVSKFCAFLCDSVPRRPLVYVPLSLVPCPLRVQDNYWCVTVVTSRRM